MKSIAVTSQVEVFTGYSCVVAWAGSDLVIPDQRAAERMRATGFKYAIACLIFDLQFMYTTINFAGS
jgi:hypothetical protein